jgi:hypothetical protein
MKAGLRLATARLLIGLVFFFNVQCGLAFLAFPQTFVSSFELAGIPGRAMVQAMGVLFLMWNVPYAVALFQPVRNRISHMQAIFMQFLGLAGEVWLVINLAVGHDALRATGIRFIWFDSFGLVALGAAFWLLRDHRAKKTQD